METIDHSFYKIKGVIVRKNVFIGFAKLKPLLDIDKNGSL